MPTSAEQAADWLLSGLELRSTLFHVGRYCGAYRASTAGRQRAFILCWKARAGFISPPKTAVLRKARGSWRAMPCSRCMTWRIA